MKKWADLSKEAGRERLREFEREVLAKIPPDRFNIQVFVSTENECGTVACAMGWAAMYPPFVELGFRVARLEKFSTIELWDNEVKWRRYGFEAVQVFFGLEPYEAAWLFHGKTYNENEEVELSEVQERVREFLEGKDILG